MFATFPAAPTLRANGAVDVVLVRACLAHGLEAPVRGGGAHDLDELLVEVAKGAIGGFAAKGAATDLREWLVVMISPLPDRARIALHLSGG